MPSAARQSFLERGYYIARDVLTPDEIKQLQRECDRLAALTDILHKDNLRCRWNPHIETGQAQIDSLDPVIDLSDVVAAVAKKPALLALMSELLADKATLFKDKLLFKPSGAPGYALHQDYISWPSFPQTFTTALFAIDASTRANGCLEVYEGEHHRGYLSPQDGDYHDLPTVLFKSEKKIAIELNPGDAVIFGCYLPHSSAPNRTAGMRRHLYLSYNAANDGGDQRVSHYNEFQIWLKKRYSEYGYNNGFFK